MNEKINWSKIQEAVEGFCKLRDIHTICYFCSEFCKNKYTYWSGQMPPNIYCGDYKDE